MKTATPTELRRHLSRHLRFVRSGNELVIVSRGEPLARILPIPASISEGERRLVAAGILKLPTEPVKNWKKFVSRFFAKPKRSVSPDRQVQQRLIRAVVEEREEGW